MEIIFQWRKTDKKNNKLSKFDSTLEGDRCQGERNKADEELECTVGMKVQF